MHAHTNARTRRLEDQAPQKGDANARHQRIQRDGVHQHTGPRQEFEFPPWQLRPPLIRFIWSTRCIWSTRLLLEQLLQL